MTKREDQAPNHLTSDLLVRAIDEELSPTEAAQVELHLANCGECRQRSRDLGSLSDAVEALANSVTPTSPIARRAQLAERLGAPHGQTAAQKPGNVLRRFGWGMAIAATLALAVVFSPGRIQTPETASPASVAHHSIQTLDVNGETFVALPYSNPDLPVSTSHIVQMKVPISSLTEAGVAFTPVSLDETAFDHSVLADVLVGMDGQPLGVHVLNVE